MTVYKRPESGVYRVQFVYTHPDGSKTHIRKTTGHTDKKKAEQFERQLRQEMLEKDERGYRPQDIPTFGEYADIFLQNYAKPLNKPSEVAKKRMILNNHLIPVFGEMRLDTINASDIKTYRSRKLTDGYKDKTVNNHMTVFYKLMGEACEDGYIRFVPRIKALKTAPPEGVYLTDDECKALLEAAEPEWRTMILVALQTGLRQGELLGLQWGDINLELGYLHVQRSISRGRIGTPKSNKHRTVPLSNDVMEALKAYRHNRGPWVFCDRNGEFLTDGQCRRPLQRAMKAAGIKKPRGHNSWHLLRHTFASRLVQSGVSIMNVQRYLGHADVRITMRYAHLSPEIKRDDVLKLDFTNEEAPIENVIPLRKKAENDG